MKKNIVCKSIKFFGKVQGVGFRYFVSELAHKFEINGWVKNEFDRTVSAEVEGEHENMNMFLEEVKIGPPFGKVIKTEVIDLSAETAKYKDFNIHF